jgi:hypothetical protein
MKDALPIFLAIAIGMGTLAVGLFVGSLMLNM